MFFSILFIAILFVLPLDSHFSLCSLASLCSLFFFSFFKFISLCSFFFLQRLSDYNTFCSLISNFCNIDFKKVHIVWLWGLWKKDFPKEERHEEIKVGEIEIIFKMTKLPLTLTNNWTECEKKSNDANLSIVKGIHPKKTAKSTKHKGFSLQLPFSKEKIKDFYINFIYVSNHGKLIVYWSWYCWTYHSCCSGDPSCMSECHSCVSSPVRMIPSPNQEKKTLVEVGSTWWIPQTIWEKHFIRPFHPIMMTINPIYVWTIVMSRLLIHVKWSGIFVMTLLFGNFTMKFLKNIILYRLKCYSLYKKINRYG